MSETRTCPWSGESFPRVTRGKQEKVFASDAVRAEAHKAARAYCEHMIESGLLSWDQVRRWYEATRHGDSAPYTAARGALEVADGR